MKKSVAVIAVLIAFSTISNAHAFGPQMLKKEFKCSDQNDYMTYIVQISGMTLSYSLKAFCSKAAGMTLDDCTAEDTPASRACFSEFKKLNSLGAGDGGLVIVNGR